MNCPKCGAGNPDNSAFCGECGAPTEGKAPEPEATPVSVSVEGVVRCRVCDTENPAGAVFCSTCRGILGAPAAGDGTVGSIPSKFEPRSEHGVALAPVAHPHAQLPKRCPSCGGPVYPDEARCRRCGAYYVAAAHAEARMAPQDASGPSLAASPGSWPELVAYLIVELLSGILRLLPGIPRLLSGLLRQLFGKSGHTEATHRRVHRSGLIRPFCAGWWSCLNCVPGEASAGTGRFWQRAAGLGREIGGMMDPEAMMYQKR